MFRKPFDAFRRNLTWVVVATISVVFLTSNVAAQAAAESALSHALSSGMGSSLGNAMGKATNRMAGRVAQQPSPAVQSPAASAQSNAKPPASAVPAATQNSASGSGSMIVSIQGGTRPASSCAANSKDAEATAPPADVPGSASQTTGCDTKADPATISHPSEITVTMPK